MFSRRLVQLSTYDLKEQYQIVAPATMRQNLFLLTLTSFRRSWLASFLWYLKIGKIKERFLDVHCFVVETVVG
jgi:hypothetical protein